MTNIYTNLLAIDRLRKSSVDNRTILTESESDRGRVLFSPAFRRLQQKAQVFSMEPNAAVRSRLTHSLEVSQIGRYIAEHVGAGLKKSNLVNEEEQAALINFVETACLMHDIGNPPFGHFGEAAISSWFRDKGVASLTAMHLSTDNCTINTPDKRLDEALADFIEFDGNPQGLRVVSKLQWNKDEYGLNLTLTTLASYLKYIRMAGIADEKKSAFTKKAGYFSSEKNVASEIDRKFGYVVPQRFPLAYIMEAADDIAYCISDLEDSIEKELLNQNDSLEEIKSRWESACKEKNVDIDQEIHHALACAAEGLDGEDEYTYTDFRTTLNRHIVKYAADRYLEKHDAILDGTLDSLLPKNSAEGIILATLKQYCLEKVYCHESVQRTELAGYAAIYGLLDHFKILLDASADRFESALDYSNTRDNKGKPIIIEKKLLKLFPEKYIKAYKHTLATLKKEGSKNFAFHEWNARAHLIVDFISGMTDDFSMTTYRMLSGMSH